MADLNKEAIWVVFLRAGHQYLYKNKEVGRTNHTKVQTKKKSKQITEGKKTKKQTPNLTKKQPKSKKPTTDPPSSLEQYFLKLL